LFSRVALNVVWNPKSFSSGLDEDTFTLSGYTQTVPGLVPASTKLNYDEFVTDGVETDFTLTATALDLFDAGDYHGFYYDDILNIKLKETGEDEGTEQTSGFAHAVGVVSGTTAPDAGILQVAYIAEIT
jgi:hypothetical protein